MQNTKQLYSQSSSKAPQKKAPPKKAPQSRQQRALFSVFFPGKADGDPDEEGEVVVGDEHQWDAPQGEGEEKGGKEARKEGVAERKKAKPVEDRE